MIEAISLASGSDGNALIVGSKKNRILVDAGILLPDLERKLRHLHIKPEDLKAIVLSHEHQDHSRGAFTIAKKFDIPICASRGTLQALFRKKPDNEVEIVELTPQEVTHIGDLYIKPITVFHDAAQPLGFVIKYKYIRIVYLVDIARVSTENMREIEAGNLCIIDCNYDRLSLLKGKYPYEVKRRIANYGHLSNEVVGNVLLNLPDKSGCRFWLAHLSRDNNSPSLACTTINYILKHGNKKNPPQFAVLPHKRLGPRWSAGEDKQVSLPMPEADFSAEVAGYLRTLSEEKKRMVQDRLERARKIRDLDVRLVYRSPGGEALGWRINGEKEQAYVVSRDVVLPGLEGIEVAGKFFTCQCGDFLFKTQKENLPCKHILKVLQLTSRKSGRH